MMHKRLQLCLYLISVMLLCSCGKDNTQEPSISPEPTVITSDIEGMKSWDAVLASVVKIENRTEKGIVHGTGFVYDSGSIITCSHVVDLEGEISVYDNAGNEYVGRIVTNSIPYDIAILECENFSLDALTIADQDVTVGENVYSIGYAFNITGDATVSGGIASAVRLSDSVVYIQSDAAANAGCSGGPLVNSLGQVVGMNAFSSENASINLAISSKSLKSLVNEIKSTPSLNYLDGERGINSLSPILKEIGYMENVVYEADKLVETPVSEENNPTDTEGAITETATQGSESVDNSTEENPATPAVTDAPKPTVTSTPKPVPTNTPKPTPTSAPKQLNTIKLTPVYEDGAWRVYDLEKILPKDDSSVSFVFSLAQRDKEKSEWGVAAFGANVNGSWKDTWPNSDFTNLFTPKYGETKEYRVELGDLLKMLGANSVRELQDFWLLVVNDGEIVSFRAESYSKFNSIPARPTATNTPTPTPDGIMIEKYFTDKVLREYIYQFDKNKDKALSDSEISAIKTIKINGGVKSIDGVYFLTSLEEIEITNCPELKDIIPLTAHSMYELGSWFDYQSDGVISDRHKSLRVMNFSGCGITSVFIQSGGAPLSKIDFSNCINLRQLDLGIGDSVVVDIRNCPNLHYFPEGVTVIE